MTAAPYQTYKVVYINHLPDDALIEKLAKNYSIAPKRSLIARIGSAPSQNFVVETSFIPQLIVDYGTARVSILSSRFRAENSADAVAHGQRILANAAGDQVTRRSTKPAVAWWIVSMTAAELAMIDVKKNLPFGTNQQKLCLHPDIFDINVSKIPQLADNKFSFFVAGPTGLKQIEALGVSRDAFTKMPVHDTKATTIATARDAAHKQLMASFNVGPSVPKKSSVRAATRRP